MIYTKYNQQLERSFFMDECAMPPPVPDDEVFGIGEESGHSPSPRSAIRSQSSVGNRSALETSSAVKKVPQSDRTAEHDGEKPVKDKRCETKCVDDHSDPLRSYQKFEDDSIFEPQGSQLKVANLPLDNQFRLALDGTVLSVSPSVKYSLPYLETEAGRNCPLRKFLPKQIYWSPQFGPDRSSSTSKKGFLQTDVPKKVPSLSSNLQEFETDHQIHPFLTVKIMGPSKNYIEVQTLLADFRAQGEMFGKGFLRKSNEGMGTLSRLDDQDIMPSNEDRLVGNC